MNWRPNTDVCSFINFSTRLTGSRGLVDGLEASLLVTVSNTGYTISLEPEMIPSNQFKSTMSKR